MNNHLIILGMAVLLICVGLSGCNEESSGGISSNGYFTLSGTISNYYNKDIELDMAVLAVENRDYDWEYWAPTKYFNFLDEKDYSFKVKSGYLKYTFLVQWYLPDNTPGDYLDDFSFSNPSGKDMRYNIAIAYDGTIEIY